MTTLQGERFANTVRDYAKKYFYIEYRYETMHDEDVQWWIKDFVAYEILPVSAEVLTYCAVVLSYRKHSSDGISKDYRLCDFVTMCRNSGVDLEYDYLAGIYDNVELLPLY